MEISQWLSDTLHSSWMPLIVFLGAFGDAFIASSLLVFGEIFFVAAGYIIAFSGHWWLLLLIWLGAWLGDTASYWVGKVYGNRLISTYVRKRAKWRLNYLRAKKLLRDKGTLTIFSARLAGPVAKLTPFLAGALHMPTAQFLSASFIGIIAGTAQFVFWGWLLAHGISSRAYLLEMIKEHPIITAISVGFALTALYLAIKKRRRTR